MVCRERSDYYEPLPDSDLEIGEEKELAREQAAQEDKYERMLMDVYNALYKVHRLAFPIIELLQGAEAVGLCAKNVAHACAACALQISKHPRMC